MSTITLEPENWLTYRGDQTAQLGQLKGPTTLGQPVTVVAAEYDPEADKTRLGFVTGDVRSELA